MSLLNTPTEKKLTVAAWSGDPAPPAPKLRPEQNAWSPSLIGVIGTVLLHSLIVPSALLGSGSHKISPLEIPDPGAASIKASTRPTESLVLIELPSITKTKDGVPDEIASNGATHKESPVTLISPDVLRNVDLKPLSMDQEKDSESAVESGDGEERARLFGIYSGQIQARIERLWRRPRTPVNDGRGSSMSGGTDEYFRCQIQVIQDLKGNVQEILLPNCNGSVSWQRSLVMAIQQSSPFPAPPSPAVFSHSMTLRFVGYSYVAGPDEGYEAAAPATAQAAVPIEH
jgi:hypothetical protein